MIPTSDDLVGANINRSPTAYLRNPASERAQYPANTDTLMVLLKMTTAGSLTPCMLCRVTLTPAGEDLGMLNWFSVHGTSMNNTNHLIKCGSCVAPMNVSLFAAATTRATPACCLRSG